MSQDKKEIQELTKEILKNYERKSIINPEELFEQPDREAVNDILDKLVKMVFPAFYREKGYRFYNVESRLTVLIEDVYYNLNKQIPIVLRQMEENSSLSEEQIAEKSESIVKEFLSRIPKVRDLVETDVQASFDGDPAAFNTNEIILCYPGLRAITISRIAHELFLLGVPLIPRMWTEYAHSRTGIDIHPGATIGKYFCIDHGTGIVVGETTIIGDYVKVYQGVTIGALSTRGGQSLRGTKRHPTIEDRVTIYAGASILGGETVIGHDAVIGSNAFITSSVGANERVSMQNCREKK
ncbi:MAG: serine acetyltransferase [Lachnospiraceae bacterium]|nr:serine acetyltransferase [Lachnospiraceae bacterium]MBR6303433.1 serine acetyltransferase [Lachnospiraceae bacterium]